MQHPPLQVRLIRFRESTSRERAQEALQEHLDVLEAIEQRDPNLAEARMRAHIRTGRENILRLGLAGDHEQGKLVSR